MNTLKKIKASAMQFAILVSVIIAVLLGSFLTLTHTHQLFNSQSKLFIKNIDAANDGIQFGLQASNSFRDSVSIKSLNTNTLLGKNFWGGFTQLESTSRSKSKEFKKMALVASEISNPATSIYISESTIPLVLVGNTKISGTAYISDKGVKSGSIAGHYYNGGELIEGRINYNASSLASLDQDWTIHINNLINYIPKQSDDMILIKEENKNSFFNQPQVIFENEPLILNEKYIGNIIIKSETEIYISKYASLSDVTVIAPKITIEKGFMGSGSFIASESIFIEEEVTLKYPSALVVAEQKEIEENSNLETPMVVSKNARINGIIVFLKNESSNQNIKNRNKIAVDINELAKLRGQVYCQGNTQLSGTVFGSVYTQKFVTRGFGSVYVNHIFSGKILANELNPKFCGLPFSNSNKGIVKWLY